jgi:hypothetical protein
MLGEMLAFERKLQEQIWPVYILYKATDLIMKTWSEFNSQQTMKMRSRSGGTCWADMYWYTTRSMCEPYMVSLGGMVMENWPNDLIS